MESDGNFRSVEYINLSRQAGIVVINPPFSLIAEYIPMLVESGKKFLVIGPLTAYKSAPIFSDIVDEKIWMGISLRSMDFVRPDETIQL